MKKYNVSLSPATISFDDARKFISAIDCGAQVFFTGTVRNHNEGKQVASLEYSAYDEMAEKLLKDFAEEALSTFDVERVYIVHRVGHLELQDLSILIAVSSHHRDAAYKASRFLIETIKHELPVWKKEHYVGEEAKWVICSHHTHEDHAHDEHR